MFPGIPFAESQLIWKLIIWQKLLFLKQSRFLNSSTQHLFQKKTNAKL